MASLVRANRKDAIVRRGASRLEIDRVCRPYVNLVARLSRNKETSILMAPSLMGPMGSALFAPKGRPWLMKN
jgi:hypothetical protein